MMDRDIATRTERIREKHEDYTEKQATFIARYIGDAELEALDQTPDLGPRYYLSWAIATKLVLKGKGIAEAYSKKYEPVNRADLMRFDATCFLEEGHVLENSGSEHNGETDVMHFASANKDPLKWRLCYLIHYRNDPNKVRKVQAPND